MPVLLHPESQCDICLDHYTYTTPDNWPHVISCGHIACKTCLLRIHACPFCRRSFNTDRIKKLHVDRWTERALPDDESPVHHEAMALIQTIALVSREHTPSGQVDETIESVHSFLRVQDQVAADDAQAHANPQSLGTLRNALDGLRRLRKYRDISRTLHRRVKDTENDKAETERRATQDRETAKLVEDGLQRRIDDQNLEWETKLESATLEIENLRTTIARFHRSADTSRPHSAALAEVASLGSELARTKAELSTSRSMEAHRTSEIAELRADLDRARLSTGRGADEALVLQSELARMRGENDTLRERVHELNALSQSFSSAGFGSYTNPPPSVARLPSIHHSTPPPDPAPNPSTPITIPGPGSAASGVRRVTSNPLPPPPIPVADHRLPEFVRTGGLLSAIPQGRARTDPNTPATTPPRPNPPSSAASSHASGHSSTGSGSAGFASSSFWEGLGRGHARHGSGSHRPEAPHRMETGSPPLGFVRSASSVQGDYPRGATGGDIPVAAHHAHHAHRHSESSAPNVTQHPPRPMAIVPGAYPDDRVIPRQPQPSQASHPHSASFSADQHSRSLSRADVIHIDERLASTGRFEYDFGYAEGVARMYGPAYADGQAMARARRDSRASQTRHAGAVPVPRSTTWLTDGIGSLGLDPGSSSGSGSGEIVGSFSDGESILRERGRRTSNASSGGRTRDASVPANRRQTTMSVSDLGVMNLPLAGESFSARRPDVSRPALQTAGSRSSTSSWGTSHTGSQTGLGGPQGQLTNLSLGNLASIGGAPRAGAPRSRHAPAASEPSGIVAPSLDDMELEYVDPAPRPSSAPDAELSPISPEPDPDDFFTPRQHPATITPNANANGQRLPSTADPGPITTSGLGMVLGGLATPPGQHAHGRSPRRSPRGAGVERPDSRTGFGRPRPMPLRTMSESQAPAQTGAVQEVHVHANANGTGARSALHNSIYGGSAHVRPSAPAPTANGVNGNGYPRAPTHRATAPAPTRTASSVYMTPMTTAPTPSATPAPVPTRTEDGAQPRSTSQDRQHRRYSGSTVLTMTSITTSTPAPAPTRTTAAPVLIPSAAIVPIPTKTAGAPLGRSGSGVSVYPARHAPFAHAQAQAQAAQQQPTPRAPNGSAHPNGNGNGNGNGNVMIGGDVPVSVSRTPSERTVAFAALPSRGEPTLVPVPPTSMRSGGSGKR